MPSPTTTFLTCAALLCCMGLGGKATAQAVKERSSSAGTEIRAVLELFTSQGCSSCPPADALLEKYAARSDIIALSLPVDYWDYLGWKDTLANPKFSKRQKLYAKERGDGKVYTPQVMVNGLVHVIGGNADLIDGAIASTAQQFAASRVQVQVHLDDKRIMIEVGGAKAGSPALEATIWLAMVHREFSIKIERGENRGKTIKYVNVVRDLNPIGMWTGLSSRHEISREALAGTGNDMCVVLVQVGKAGPIIGAAKAEGL